jgi:DNA-binding response OmpR family regulator
MTALISRRDDLNVVAAHSGKDGMKLANDSPPAVVVLDTGLSDIFATDVLKGLQESAMTAHIPVIAVSSAAYPMQIQAGLQAGFYRYLTKPYKLTDLLDAIDSSLRYSAGKSESLLTSFRA